MKTPKISAAQLMLILLLARLMHTMIFRADGFDSGTPIMLGLAVSTAVEMVMFIPAALCCSGGGAISCLPANRAVRLLYSLYFTVIAGGTAALFAEFLHREFTDSVAPIAAIILIAAAAGYCAYAGIEGLARAGTVVFILFAALFAAMVLVSEGKFDWLNLRPMTSGDVPAFRKYILESLSSSWQIPMLAILGEHLRKGAFKAAYGFIALKFVIIETLLLLITLVLWRYVGVLGYPIYALGAYAKSDFIQRFDAINMLIWAINCVFVSAVYVFLSSKISPEPKKGAAVFAALAAVIAIYEYKRGLRYDDMWFMLFKLGGVILLGVIIPTAAVIYRKIRGREGPIVEKA